MPDVPVSLPHLILPEMQTYGRTLTTVANAAMRPIVCNDVRNLRARLRDLGMKGRIALLRSDGGLMSSREGFRLPPVKPYRKAELQTDSLKIAATRLRMPEWCKAGLHALVAACRGGRAPRGRDLRALC